MGNEISKALVVFVLIMGIISVGIVCNNKTNARDESKIEMSKITDHGGGLFYIDAYRSDEFRPILQSLIAKKRSEGYVVAAIWIYDKEAPLPGYYVLFEKRYN